jgi:hypothetical protein
MPIRKGPLQTTPLWMINMHLNDAYSPQPPRVPRCWASSPLPFTDGGANFRDSACSGEAASCRRSSSDNESHLGRNAAVPAAEWTRERQHGRAAGAWGIGSGDDPCSSQAGQRCYLRPSAAIAKSASRTMSVVVSFSGRQATSQSSRISTTRSSCLPIKSRSLRSMKLRNSRSSEARTKYLRLNRG